MRILLFCFVFLLLSVDGNALGIDLNPKDWTLIKGVHFEIYSPVTDGTEVPRTILRKAEEYYDKIAERIGYARYKNFWTWDQRVKIVYYSSQEAYSASTGQPAWSKGLSFSHGQPSLLRMIVSFKGQDNFVDEVLPHEISHLILHDLIGQDRNIPLWFDEGVAQLDEPRNDETNKKALAALILNNKTIPLSLLSSFSPRSQTNEMGIQIFYAESLYIIDFLIKTYGKDLFAKLCRLLRDGQIFEEALKQAYFPMIVSMDDLQEKWFKYMVQ